MPPPTAARNNRRVEVQVDRCGHLGPVEIISPVVNYRVSVDGGEVAVTNGRVTVLLPDGMSYVKGSATVRRCGGRSRT